MYPIMADETDDEVDPTDEYEWDRKKAKENEEKHGVSFEEAITAFQDDRGLYLPDPQQHEEERFILIGMAASTRILFVVHAEVVTRNRTRIISARVASKRQRLMYTGDVEE